MADGQHGANVPQVGGLMATSGTFNFTESSYGSGTGYPCYAKIDWSATWSDSSMLWTVNWSATAQGGSTAGRWATVFSGSVTVTDGTNTLQTKSMSARIEQAKNNTVLLSGSFTVGTDANGNRNLAFSGQFQFETTAASGKSSGSQTFALDTKAMASTISSLTSNVTVGSSGGSSTVSISRKSSSYTHTVVWTFGSNTHTETGVATSKSYTIPASWLSAIPNAASGAGTVTVTTYNGSTQIGQPVSTTFTITAGVNPSIGSVSVAPRGAAYNAGITSVYIAGYSTALITASSVAGVNGSTIKKVEFIRDGAVLSSNTTPIYTYTTGTLTGSSATFSVRVTDSRGRTATKAASAVTIQAYSLPAITANAFRSNSSGTAASDGTYIRITASATATPSANSITALTYATKATTASSYSSEANIGSGVTKSGFSNTTSYDVRIKATDKLGGVAYKYFTIPTASYTMDFKVGGKGVAFGKVAETDNLVDSAWGIRSGGDVTATANLRIEATATSNPTLFFENENGDRRQFLQYNKASRVARFVCYSQNSGTEEPLGYYEVYDLPATDQDRTGNASYKIITTKNISDIPDASASQRGLVSTGTQTFAGNKTFNGTVTSGNDAVVGAAGSPTLRFECPVGARFGDVAIRTTATNGVQRPVDMVLRTWSYNSSTGAKIGHYDQYQLPEATPNKTKNDGYYILTTKNPVAVEHGGTGATTAAAARSNLGLGASANLLSGTLTTTEVTLSGAAEYTALVIIGRPSGGAYSSITLPMSTISTTAYTWQLADNSNYESFSIRRSGSDVLIKKVASSGSATITEIYGLR